MATNKPKIVIYSDEKTIEELDNIAKLNNRSRGNMAETIIKEYIEKFKASHKKLESLDSQETKNTRIS